MYYMLALLLLGVLIMAHEAGHFLAARAWGIGVQEFAMGMGPLLFHREKGGTQYSVRLLPVGGLCAMGGEDSAPDDDPASFANQKAWKRFIILVSGAAVNFLVNACKVILLKHAVCKAARYKRRNKPYTCASLLFHGAEEFLFAVLVHEHKGTAYENAYEAGKTGEVKQIRLGFVYRVLSPF